MMSITRREIWFALFVIAVFALGAATAVGVVRYARLGPPFGPSGPVGVGALGPPPTSAMVVERMTRDLGLSAEQQKQVEEVLRRSSDRFEQFHATTRSQFENLRRQLNEEIEPILTPEQRARFRQYVSEAPGPRPAPPR